MIVKGRVYGASSSAGGPRTVALRIRSHGSWSTAARLRLDERGRFSMRPHLRRVKRSGKGHSRLMIGTGYVPFSARQLQVRAVVSGGEHSRTIRLRLRR
jgi:hypothetical protein